jgi:hypothetical protein
LYDASIKRKHRRSQQKALLPHHLLSRPASYIRQKKTPAVEQKPVVRRVQERVDQATEVHNEAKPVIRKVEKASSADAPDVKKPIVRRVGVGKTEETPPATPREQISVVRRVPHSVDEAEPMSEASAQVTPREKKSVVRRVQSNVASKDEEPAAVQANVVRRMDKSSAPEVDDKSVVRRVGKSETRAQDVNMVRRAGKDTKFEVPVWSDGEVGEEGDGFAPVYGY